jgi:CDP-diacylglycerol--glycerol-3-phosphate 3-phosphatidyltransferase
MDNDKQDLKMWMRNLPNKLTLFRIAVIPVIAFLYIWDIRPLNYLAAALFAVGAITDFLDGYIARMTNNVTRIGEVLDPISDKLLVLAALVILTEAQIIGGWITIIVLCREIGISGLRLAASEQGFSIKVSSYGKIKTAFQDVAIVLLLLRLDEYHVPGMVLLWVSIAFSYFSAWAYWNKFWEHSKHNFQ